MIKRFRMNFILLAIAFLLLSCNHTILQSKIGNEGLPEKLQPLPKKIKKPAADTEDNKGLNETNKKEEQGNRELTNADMADLAAHTGLGAGLGGTIGGIIYLVTANTVLTSTAVEVIGEAAIGAVTETVTPAAIETATESVPTIIAATTKAVGAATTKVAAATGTTLSAPWLIGGGIVAGGGLGLYWGWRKWNNK